MKKFNSIDYLIFVLLLSVTITNAERSWRETAGEWTETGKEYRKSAFNAVRNNRKTAIAIGVGVGVLTAAYMARNRFKTMWEKYAPERLGGSKRKLTPEEQLYQQTEEDLKQTEKDLNDFNFLITKMTSFGLSSKETKKKTALETILSNRYNKLESKKNCTENENLQLTRISEALGLAETYAKTHGRGW